MELIYFILGFLFTVGAYGVILFKKTKASHAVLLDRYQMQTNISALREAELAGEIECLKLMVNDIQTNMEKDQYESLSAVNKTINELQLTVNTNTKNIKYSDSTFNKNITNAFNEIMQLKNNLKALAQDPNMSSTY